MTSYSIFIIFFLSIILCFVILPLITSLSIWLFSKILKFKKNDYKTAVQTSLVIFGIGFLLNALFTMVFFNARQQSIPPIIESVFLLTSFIAGIYVVHKLYNETISKSFWMLFLGGIAILIAVIIISIPVSIIMFPYLTK